MGPFLFSEEALLTILWAKAALSGAPTSFLGKPAANFCSIDTILLRTPRPRDPDNSRMLGKLCEAGAAQNTEDNGTGTARQVSCEHAFYLVELWMFYASVQPFFQILLSFLD